MKKAFFVLLLAILLVGCTNANTAAPTSTPTPTPTPTPTSAPSPSPVLEKIITITSVCFSPDSGIMYVTADDETGKEIKLTGDLTEWFYGVSSYEATLPAGSSMTVTGDGFFLADGSEIDVSFDGGSSAVVLKVGSQFDYMIDSDGNIKLLIDNMPNPASTPQ